MLGCQGHKLGGDAMLGGGSNLLGEQFFDPIQDYKFLSMQRL